ALGRVHPRLLNKRLLSLDIGLLVAGTQYRGQFEDRLKSLLRALQHSEGGILMFIDEVHQLLGLGQTSGAMDAANLMKPALARGELRCIGATTYEEFSYFERDAALRRRFQPINVSEPNELDTATIIERIAPSFEAFHAVRYNRECIQSVVTLGRRYLGELHSPAREIGLLDEVGAKASLAANAEIAGRASLP
ncbi:MAG: ATP-dependent Clp protease ATP-binding subunit, partial [Mesorhizobium sp.]